MPSRSGGYLHFTPEARALFAEFANRHGLTYVENHEAPVEVLWEFPVQAKLSEPIVLGLQNADELNFGGGKFWSYFFPFRDEVESFEQVIDAWVAGEARVVSRLFGEELQLREGERWSGVYSALRLWPDFKRGPVIQHRPSP